MKYCERCGEDPDMELAQCIECGEQLCERCYGSEHGFVDGKCLICKTYEARRSMGGRVTEAEKRHILFARSRGCGCWLCNAAIVQAEHLGR